MKTKNNIKTGNQIWVEIQDILIKQHHLNGIPLRNSEEKKLKKLLEKTYMEVL